MQNKITPVPTANLPSRSCLNTHSEFPWGNYPGSIKAFTFLLYEFNLHHRIYGYLTLDYTFVCLFLYHVLPLECKLTEEA